MFQPKAVAPGGRGSATNPHNRFEKLAIELEPEALVDEDGQPIRPRTQFLRDDSQSIVSYNNSPDIPFAAGLNPYRGCEHGCAYCFARPFHEYLGFSSGLDFETKIVVKENAPELLRAELSRKKWVPQVLTMSAISDAYQPVERRLQLTRRCLAVLAEFRNPVGIITKNHLVTRDIDYLSELARYHAATVSISITSLDPELAKTLEPRASPPSRRLAAIEELSAAGIPVNAMTAPIIPGLNDHELPDLLAAAAQAGARSAGFTVLRLPYAVAPLFVEWLERHAPGHKDKVLSRICSMRGGKLYDAKWGARMKGEGFFAEQIKALFHLGYRKAGFRGEIPEYDVSHFRVRSAFPLRGLSDDPVVNDGPRKARKSTKRRQPLSCLFVYFVDQSPMLGFPQCIQQCKERGVSDR
ncbi:MAG: PA0069 family radical SAM protein [Chthoniobacter sp.]